MARILRPERIRIKHIMRNHIPLAPNSDRTIDCGRWQFSAPPFCVASGKFASFIYVFAAAVDRPGGAGLVNSSPQEGARA